MSVIPFGTLRDGRVVHDVELGKGGPLAVSILDRGAALRDIRLMTPNGALPLILGFDRLEHYVAHSPYFGAVCGRCANRIAGGRFTLDGVEYQLALNEGENQLHGGPLGYDKRVWDIGFADDHRVRFDLVDADGDQGYPGLVRISATYTLEGTHLVMEIEATTDRPTLVNIAGHAYFDLDGTGSILDHEATIFADRYTPSRPDLIPTGEILPVAGSDFDFRAPRPIRREVDGTRVAYDVNFALAEAPVPLPRLAARVRGPKTGVTLEVWTTEPGIQLYDGSGLDVSVPGLDERRYGPNAGFCLEPQRWPNAANQPSFPSAVLRPGELYRQRTEYRFSL
ncbi:galactose mutarotase [Siculibacillus lacustris]|uniref:Aldose 1-epimerase n=1 Tax=Siculibacillus lacustris TaxID=1549641 RepID=A0A4Q9VIY5_9HYPH|nr:aldose epimerase family protein [Siculibacillus lacustris]TBW35241.1 galactose mutarotase [Siculibacillus lacustris]